MSVADPRTQRLRRLRISRQFLMRCDLRTVTALLAAVLLLGACTRGDSTEEVPASSQRGAVASNIAVGNDDQSDVYRLAVAAGFLTSGDDLRNLSIAEVNDGPATQQLGAARLLREVGVMELLDSYIVNIPLTAESIAAWELTTAWVANLYHYDETEPAQQALGDFEDRALSAALVALRSSGQRDGPQQLHDAFFSVLDQCGRGSPWPAVELFAMADGHGYDVEPHLIESEFGLTYFEYQQLRHQCARYAATYPALDPAMRDEMLAPQRAHYARVILERLDDELPLVEVPPQYQADIDDLRSNGW